LLFAWSIERLTDLAIVARSSIVDGQIDSAIANSPMTQQSQNRESVIGHCGALSLKQSHQRSSSANLPDHRRFNRGARQRR
jgi:hypothetical protein